MPPFPSKDDGFRPHKRTGVWSTETVKQKGAAPERVLKHPPAQDSVEGNTNDNDDENNFHSKTSFNDVVKNPTKSKLFKLPALSTWNDINIGLLLNQFNDEEDLKDEDTVWTYDSLFTEVKRKLGK